MRIFALLLVVGIIFLRGMESRQLSRQVAQPGACVVTAVDLAARHPCSRILFVRYFGQPLGHAYAAWKQGNKIVLADHRGTVTMPTIAWDSAYVCATFAPPPIEGYIFSSAQFVYESR